MTERICGCCEVRPVHIRSNGVSRSACYECFRILRQLQRYWQDKGMPIRAGRRHRMMLRSIPREVAAA